MSVRMYKLIRLKYFLVLSYGIGDLPISSLRYVQEMTDVNNSTHSQQIDSALELSFKLKTNVHIS